MKNKEKSIVKINFFTFIGIFLLCFFVLGCSDTGSSYDRQPSKSESEIEGKTTDNSIKIKDMKNAAEEKELDKNGSMSEKEEMDMLIPIAKARSLDEAAVRDIVNIMKKCGVQFDKIEYVGSDYKGAKVIGDYSANLYSFRINGLNGPTAILTLEFIVEPTPSSKVTFQRIYIGDPLDKNFYLFIKGYEPRTLDYAINHITDKNVRKNVEIQLEKYFNEEKLASLGTKKIITPCDISGATLIEEPVSSKDDLTTKSYKLLHSKLGYRVSCNYITKRNKVYGDDGYDRHTIDFLYVDGILKEYKK